MGDNGRYFVDAYQADTAMDNKHMVTESPGTNPVIKPEFKGRDWFENHKGEWIEFRWAEMQYEMEKDGVSNAGEKMGAFLDKYFASQSAKDYQGVMNDFGLMESKARGCK